MMCNQYNALQVERFIVIAGPCLLENEQIVDEVARELVKICAEYDCVRLIFKASVDKANRSSVRSARGIGVQEGLEILAEIKRRYAIEVTTDFHEPKQADLVAEVCDVLQVPAFLCRQTDMLAAAARTGPSVSVKKGQFLSPWDMAHVIGKLRTFGAKEILQIERGTSFGYGNLVVDMRSFQIMAENCCPVIFDLTHSLQLPGNGNDTTAGAREFADTLALAAIGAGINGIFIETHPDPTKALCDKETQISLNSMKNRLGKYVAMQKFRTTLYEGRIYNSNKLMNLLK
jgi:2-dehydro-3-deoxyphosphooctonate aldolase (KDO 8-P synthase)